MRMFFARLVVILLSSYHHHYAFGRQTGFIIGYGKSKQKQQQQVYPVTRPQFVLVKQEQKPTIGTATTTRRRNTNTELFFSVGGGGGSSSGPVAEEVLWLIRGLSAVVSYVGFVAYLDRPQGSLIAEDCLEVKTSNVPNAGLGLFAKRTIEQGTVLGTYPGVVIPLTQNLQKLREHPQCEGYIWRFSDNSAIIDPTNTIGVLDDTVGGGNPSTPLSRFLFSSLLAAWKTPTVLCRINEPPKGFDVNVVTEEDIPNKCVTFTTERTVFAGEEFFIDYGLTYDRSRYGGS